MLPLDLPVAAELPALRAALAAQPNAVLVAPPGAGKTTLVPLALLEAPWRGDGRIVMLEPRRLAARAAAARMAALRGESVGQTVGYRTRLDSAVSATTRIEVVTDGLLVRRMQSDPGLEGVAAVIFDEVHERGLAADLALALCLDLQRGLRPELRLLAMSATAEAARLAGLLGAPVLESPGGAHSVAIEHAARDLAGAEALPGAVAAAVRAALARHPGDVLAFLPGMAEIRRAAAALEGCAAAVLPLHGELTPAEQDAALRPGAQRRVVLATSIAETSLTVPGVRIVVDGGFRRAPRFDPGRGLTRLATLRISRAAAEQRAGRAGREAPGVAIRLWTEAQHRGLPAFDRPEIFEAELSGLRLDCAAWGAAPADLPFPDPPPGGALAAAEALLERLGAMAAGRITPLGRRMAALGAEPRLAAMMLAADAASAGLAAELAAIVEERDPLRAEAADITLRLGARDGRIRAAAAQYRRRLGAGAGIAGDPGPLIAAGFPDRIAQRRGALGQFRLAGGGAAFLPTGDPLAAAPLLAVARLDGDGRIRLAAPLDPAALPASLAAQQSETVETAFDPASGVVQARRRRCLGAAVLAEQCEPADPDVAARALAAAAPFPALPFDAPARQLQARVALMRGLEPDVGWPDLSDAALAADRTWLVAPLHGCTRLSDLAALDIAAILRDRLGAARMRRLDAELPQRIALPGGHAVVDYTAPVPLAAARAQAFYGLAELPPLAAGRVPLRIALLSPAGRPAAITGDLAGFWRGAWAEVRRDLRGRYPRHHWPEHPERPSARR
jgi:ATP-dependent helicase HrpB